VRPERFRKENGGIGARLQVASVLCELGKQKQWAPRVVDGQGHERAVRKARWVAGNRRQGRRLRLRGKSAAAFRVARRTSVRDGVVLAG
jgi:hypothetical protein